MRSFLGKQSTEVREWLLQQNFLHKLETQACRPLLPLPDNFTPPTRTPWGGTKILGQYKHDLSIREHRQYPVVGESWEISADPAFPNEFRFFLDSKAVALDLIQVLDIFPDQILGTKVAQKFENQNPILTKMLDAEDHLSVQVHPSDKYVNLKADESGKPESWYILESKPGCGLYLGLKPNISKEALRQAIEQGDEISCHLNFVEVHPGDFFVIDAGTIHAVGAGVTLIEPQKIAPKRSGKTYRLWDWNRTYDAQGRKDPHGKPRALDIEDSFTVIDFDGPRGEEFVEQIQPQKVAVQQNGKSVELCCVETENFGVSQIVLQDRQELSGDCRASFHGLVPYEGQIDIVKDGQKLAEVPKGQSVIIPAALEEYTLTGDHAKAVKIYYPEQYL